MAISIANDESGEPGKAAGETGERGRVRAIARQREDRGLGEVEAGGVGSGRERGKRARQGQVAAYADGAGTGADRPLLSDTPSPVAAVVLVMVPALLRTMFVSSRRSMADKCFA